jgi:hypothetical protein
MWNDHGVAIADLAAELGRTISALHRVFRCRLLISIHPLYPPPQSVDIPWLAALSDPRQPYLVGVIRHET